MVRYSVPAYDIPFETLIDMAIESILEYRKISVYRSKRYTI